MVNLAQLFDFLVFIVEHSMLSYQIQTGKYADLLPWLVNRVSLG